MLERATEPLRRALRDAELRMADLERRLSASPAPPDASDPLNLPIVAAPAGAVVSAASASGPAQYASAISRPPPHRAPALSALEIEAMTRSVPMDDDIRAFDGRRRRLRMILLGVFAVLLVFGGLFAMLAESYTHAHR